LEDGGAGAEGWEEERRRRRHAHRVLARARSPAIHSQSRSHSSKRPTTRRQRSETNTLAPRCYSWPPLSGRHLQASCIFTTSHSRRPHSVPPLSFVLTRPLLPTSEASRLCEPTRPPKPVQSRSFSGASGRRLLTVTRLQLLDANHLRRAGEYYVGRIKTHPRSHARFTGVVLA
jgi:hypothetical protein